MGEAVGEARYMCIDRWEGEREWAGGEAGWGQEASVRERGEGER